MGLPNIVPVHVLLHDHQQPRQSRSRHADDHLDRRCRARRRQEHHLGQPARPDRRDVVLSDEATCGAGKSHTSRRRFDSASDLSFYNVSGWLDRTGNPRAHGRGDVDLAGPATRARRIAQLATNRHGVTDDGDEADPDGGDGDRAGAVRLITAARVRSRRPRSVRRSVTRRRSPVRAGTPTGDVDFTVYYGNTTCPAGQQQERRSRWSVASRIRATTQRSRRVASS